MESTALAAVRMPFNNDIVRAGQLSGVTHVVCKDVCENLGVDWDSQCRKIANDEFYRGKLSYCRIAATDGKMYQTAVLPVKYARLWIAGISTNSVAYHARERLIAYKEFCCDAIEKALEGPKEATFNLADVITQTVSATIRELLPLITRQTATPEPTPTPKPRRQVAPSGCNMTYSEAQQAGYLTVEMVLCSHFGITRSALPKHLASIGQRAARKYIARHSVRPNRILTGFGASHAIYSKRDYDLVIEAYQEWKANRSPF